MATVLFVHGIGVREPSYSDTFNRIKGELYDRKPSIKVEKCYWGEPFGAILHMNGASVPTYDTTRAIDDVSNEEYMIALWSMLYQDPLYELRLLVFQGTGKPASVIGQESPGDELKDQVRNLTISTELQLLLEKGGISGEFNTARHTVMGSSSYNDALKTAPQALGPYRMAIARAIVAESIALHGEQGSEASIAIDAKLRDTTVDMIAEALGGTDRSIGGWTLKQLFGLAQRLGAMDQVQRKRGAVTDAIYPVAGDVVLYQGRGDSIRSFIHKRIKEVASGPGSVILLTHSLGGIACVDLLVEESLPEVRQLITVGSQAPFLYEIGALHSLPPDQPLPAHVPPWLNIYDLRDFLSYIGNGVFPGKVEDVLVDSKLPFPQSHSAYWTNTKTWDAVSRRLP